jgi:hypothetical protein
MNKIFIYLLAVLVYFNMYSQKRIHKIIDFKGTYLRTNLGEIDHLKLVQSDVRQVVITAVESKPESNILKINQSDNSLYIEAIKTDFDNQDLPVCIEQPLFTSYSITIPKNIKVLITIESGNFIAKNFDGFLDLKVKQGEIILEDVSGNIKVDLIDGNVFCETNIFNIKATSNQGKILIDKSKNNQKYLNDLLIIKSINGNIFINKDKTP